MKTYMPKIAHGTTLVFRGCSWDACWEFDVPCILYSPVRRYRIGSAYDIESMVEDVCCDLADGEAVAKEFGDSDLKEFEWRGWSPRGFSRRRNAVHFKVTVRFVKPSNDEDDYDGFNFQLMKVEEETGCHP